ncbi:MAG: diacylglycerol kinase [Patescibacteria group bacterium]|nr:diacylglycerol kinase [Patescibacteria group bacterium]
MDNIKKLFKSFHHAFRGLKYVLKNEQNFQLEILIGIFVIILMFIFDIRDWQKVALFLVIFSVLVIELINTIMERVVDILKPRVHPYAQLIKDIMATTVLLASVGAIVIGIIIFYPYIKQMLLQGF